ncbi:MAG: hypothetical protein R2682_05535 [Pyrinomonadaceae bacterium]
MDEKYKGMTVNERLWVSGLMDAFADAVKKKDIGRAREILKQVELTEGNIKPILERHGLVTQKD